MSNNKEEKNDGLGKGYFENLGKIRERNEAVMQEHEALQHAEGNKPTPEILPKVLTEQEMHDEAKEMTKSQDEAEQYVQKSGLAKMLEKAKSPETIDQAREEQRQEQAQERTHNREQDI